MKFNFAFLFAIPAPLLLLWEPRRVGGFVPVPTTTTLSSPIRAVDITSKRFRALSRVQQHRGRRPCSVPIFDQVGSSTTTTTTSRRVNLLVSDTVSRDSAKNPDENANSFLTQL